MQSASDLFGKASYSSEALRVGGTLEWREIERRTLARQKRMRMKAAPPLTSPEVRVGQGRVPRGVSAGDSGLVGLVELR